MIYVISLCPDIEEILVNEMRKYFVDEIRFGDIYPNFSKIRIDMTHPFAFLMDNLINNTKVPVDLFPSITIFAPNDSKAVEVKPILKDIQIKTAEITDIENNRDRYIMSDTDLQALKTLVQAETYKWSKGAGTIKRASIEIQVWADNITLKNKIYDLVQLFFIGKKRYELNEYHEIKVNEEAITGQRSGNYNFDFGKIYYGGMINLSVDYVLNQFFVDTETASLDSVIHTAAEVHHGGS